MRHRRCNRGDQKKKTGSTGHVIGADTSRAAIRMAKKCNKRPDVDFVNMDAERLCFSEKFDIVACQYALFFFPDAQRVLKNMRNSLKKSGRLGISVHGSREKVPFFSSILDPAARFIPDCVPPGSPDLDRFGTRSALRDEVSRAGFSSIAAEEFVSGYSPGKFEGYWRNYLRYVASPLKERLDGLDPAKRRELRRAGENCPVYKKRRADCISMACPDFDCTIHVGFWENRWIFKF